MDDAGPCENPRGLPDVSGRLGFCGIPAAFMVAKNGSSNLMFIVIGTYANDPQISVDKFATLADAIRFANATATYERTLYLEVYDPERICVHQAFH